MNCTDKSYCRLCAKLKPRDKLNDFLSDQEKRDIIEKLIRVNATIDTFEETFPKTVCFVCIGLLQQAFDFVLQVEKAQEVLRDEFLLQNVTTTKGEELTTFDDGGDDLLSHEEVTIKVETEIVDVTLAPKLEVKPSRRNLDTPSNCLKWDDYCWLCGICDTQFPDLSSLHEHSMFYHNTCNPYRCANCHKRVFNIEKFIKHVSAHVKHLQLSCYKCGEFYKNSNAFKEHRCLHVSSEFVCRGCNVSFTSQEDLKRHQEKYYSTHKVRIIPDKLKQTDLTCKLCGKTAKSNATLINHLLTHTDRARNHICEICGKTCLRKYDLDIHMLTHSEVRSYTCNVCNSTFKTDYYLRIHYSLHEKVKPFACNICGKRFRLKKQVNFHQIVHSDSDPYNCEVCGKGFKFKNKLKVHERQHSGLMPYSCNTCERAFTDWSNYSKHMKGMHNTDIRKRKNIITTVPVELKEIKKPGRPKLKSKKGVISETEK